MQTFLVKYFASLNPFIMAGERTFQEEIRITQGAGAFCILNWLTIGCVGVIPIAATIVLRAFVYTV